jgi:FKBP-type peptidyl-prolyl cis-trans isomerase
MMNRARLKGKAMKKPVEMMPGPIWVLAVVLLLAGVCRAQAEYTQTPSGLRYQDLKAGSGETAQTGKVAVIHFRAWLDDNGAKGAKFFDTRKQRGEPVAFKVGTDKVMPGWNIGVAGMKKGGKRRLMIPAALGYGAKSAGEVVPPNADLIFEVELVDVR